MKTVLCSLCQYLQCIPAIRHRCAGCEQCGGQATLARVLSEQHLLVRVPHIQSPCACGFASFMLRMTV